MSVSPTWASDLVVEDENGGGTGGVVTVVESKEPEAPASRRGSCAGEEGDAFMPLVNDMFGGEGGGGALAQLPPLGAGGSPGARPGGGYVMVFGASSAGQFKCSAKRGTQYFGDDVSMLLCGSRKPQLVHYSVKTTEVTHRAGQESAIPNFKGSFLGRFPLVLADLWTSDHLSERSRSVDAFSGTRARGTLTLKRH